MHTQMQIYIYIYIYIYTYIKNWLEVTHEIEKPQFLHKENELSQIVVKLTDKVLSRVIPIRQ